MHTHSLILLRGLPGSGKSTLATLLSEHNTYPFYSVDDYFIDKETGIYKFDFKNNQYAYKQCQESTERSMQEKSLKIFVHNTFTMDWEMEPYFKLAACYNYSIFIVTVENYHNQKNIHDISDEQLQKMAKKYKIRLL